MTAGDTTAPKDPRPGRPEGERARSAARLGAVQALFQMEISGAGASQIADEFRLHRFTNTDEDNPLAKADARHFKRTLEGAVRHQARIDRAVNETLKQGWPLRRIDPTLRALFRAAGGEFMALPNVPRKVVINEYVEVAKAFFDDDSPRFANAVLDRIARILREDEPVSR